jgi:hypothetical protein
MQALCATGRPWSVSAHQKLADMQATGVPCFYRLIKPMLDLRQSFSQWLYDILKMSPYRKSFTKADIKACDGVCDVSWWDVRWRLMVSGRRSVRCVAVI